jgi:hypothetical protein
MRIGKSKLGAMGAVVVLAISLAAGSTMQAAQAPDTAGKSVNVSAKQPTQKNDKNGKQKALSSKGAKGQQSKAAASAAQANDVAQLKQEIALQQKQINQLLHAVEQLNARLESATRPVPAASAAPLPSDGQVASLVPVLPAEAPHHAGTNGQLLNLNISANPTGATAGGAAGLGAAVQRGSSVSDAVTETPAAQENKSKPLDFDNGKVKIGATFYGFYRYFTQTGFGPQTLDNTDIHPGPGNDGFNEFNINRTYVNIFYSPIDAITFRVTPNVYREVGGASAEKLSTTSATGSSVNGNLTFRLKYAYVDFNKLFAHSEAFGKDKLTFGQEQQPLTDWEEGLYGYRFVNLTPWNYLSLSSTYTGLKLHGPIEFHGKQYLDYEIGAFNNSSYHAYEVGDKKQVMARLSYYPFGAVSKYQGLGLTGFVDYGYKDTAPDMNTKVPITRVAALVHYESKSGDYGIAGEYDYGRNAFSVGNLFSGSGPADAFGLGPTPYATFNSLAAALLAGTHTNQRGFDFFGHARIAKSPFYLFGMFEQFNPNTNVETNPLDFRTVIGGVSYHYGKYWQFALDSQNILYYHSQFTFPASELAQFSSSLAASNPNGIPNAVPDNTNAIFFNVLFNY